MIYMVIFQSCCALLDNTLFLFALEHFSTKKEDISQQTVFSFSWSKSKKSFIFMFPMSNNGYKKSAYLEKILKILFSLPLVPLEVKNSNFHKKFPNLVFCTWGFLGIRIRNFLFWPRESEGHRPLWNAPAICMSLWNVLEHYYWCFIIIVKKT